MIYHCLMDSKSFCEMSDLTYVDVKWVYGLKTGDDVEIVDKFDQWWCGKVISSSKEFLTIFYGNNITWDRENFTTILSRPGTHIKNKGFTCLSCNTLSRDWPIQCSCADKEDNRIREKMVGSKILVSRTSKYGELSELVLEKNGEIFFVSETYWRTYNDGFYEGVGMWTKLKESSFKDYLVYTRPSLYRYIEHGKSYDVYEPDLKSFVNRDTIKEWIPTYDPIVDDKRRAEEIQGLVKK